ncbi:MAG: rod shape-determining protein RodA [Bacillota bacterium]
MPMMDRRLIKNFDFYLVLLVLILCAVGTLILFSATRGMELSDPLHFVRRQVMITACGLAGMFALCFVDYINFQNWARYLYAGNLVLLTLVLFLGRTAKGSMRWITVGFFDLQPSEIAKIVLIIILAKLLANREGKFYFFQDLMPSLLAAALPMGLIFLQPDLGTSLVFSAILIGMFYVAGVRSKHMLALAGAGLIAAPLAWFFLLQDYQKSRLMVFINPEMDPTGAGWQLLQSMIGIGSGGPFGKGLFESTQVRLQFLPEHYTDFIFSVFGEELGFVGAAGLLIIFFLLIYRVLWIGTHAKDQFGALLCCGVAVMFTFQVLVNIGMTISIMPVTGLPLPFLSYGNNAMLVNLISIGLVLNVGMRRHKIQF